LPSAAVIRHLALAVAIAHSAPLSASISATTDAAWTNANAQVNANAAAKPNSAKVPSQASLDRLFPTDAVVRKQVRFWELIFQRYPSSTIVIHDFDEPDRIVDLIDFVMFAERDGKKAVPVREERVKVSTRYLERYAIAVDRFAAEGRAALRHGAIEKRLWNVYGASPESLRRLLEGRVRLRSQSGLADTFVDAANKAQDYLPYMESVFRTYGLPTRLTRIAFVESMFNFEAVSKVGASGLWQFMPSTAKHYMYVGRSIDERNSPYKATRAAAQLLKDNHEILRSWPLAVTAYNHGAAGMNRGAREVGSRDLGKIIRGYRSASFGFASQNFYGEFIAAANTYDWLIATGRVRKRSPVKDDTPITLSRPMTMPQLMRTTGLSEETILKHNACILPSAFRTYMNKPLPKGYEIRVPNGRVAQVKKSLQSGKPAATISRR